MTTQPWLQSTFRVGKRKCTITYDQAPERGAAMVVRAEWSPTVPKRLTKKEIRQYRAARDDMVAEIARLTGFNVGVFEC
jgi:hypothetical protein